MSMSALLNHNPRRLVSWKGRTINQIASVLQKNTPTASDIATGSNLFRALPLKIYRRESAVNVRTNATFGEGEAVTGVCASRKSTSIDELMRPGGSYLTRRSGATAGGWVGTEFDPTPSTQHESYGCPTSAADSANCAATNARRRCRSSGMVRKTYDPARGDSAYFTNNAQYLVSRSKSFQQNQYRHVRRADVSVVSNPLETSESYSPNGISHCPKAQVVAGANVFSYHWVDATSTESTLYDVVVPPGFYDVHGLNAVFESTMEANHHYYVHKATHQHAYLAKIIYNATESKIELQAFPTALVADTNVYALPLNATWSTPVVSTVPVFYVPDTGIQSVLGFDAGYYPPLDPDGNPDNQRASSFGILSSRPASLHPSYTVMTYKPSNVRFATQGAVTSSDLLVRRKYETITRNGLGFTNTYGSQVGSAMAYGKSEEPYTLKAKIGYPNTRTPLFPKWSDRMQCAEHGRVVGFCSSA